jgi:hypothetical protein
MRCKPNIKPFVQSNLIPPLRVIGCQSSESAKVSYILGTSGERKKEKEPLKLYKMVQQTLPDCTLA